MGSCTACGCNERIHWISSQNHIQGELVSRLSDLIANAEAKDPQLGTDLECEFRALSSRLSPLASISTGRRARVGAAATRPHPKKRPGGGASGSANQFNKFQEGCVEENTNTAAIVLR
jgi:hypothetical protein